MQTEIHRIRARGREKDVDQEIERMTEIKREDDIKSKYFADRNT